ncbi:MAG: hypothetical protein ACREOK_08190 [Gemmatimonadaceae bacterium]
MLTFPQAGIDDTAAYQGYQTRFYRDAAGNTVQIYMEGRSGRVVHLLANADNESVGFTVRAPDGVAPDLDWADSVATAGSSGQGVAAFRTLTHQLIAGAPRINLGWFLLGSMRVERDFQYWGRHRQPFTAARFTLAENDSLLAALQRLPDAERRRHLQLLNSPSVSLLRNRMHPRYEERREGNIWTARITQLSLDMQDSLAVEISVDTRHIAATLSGDSVMLRARSGSVVPFTVTVASSADALTPLTRDEIFTPEFLAWVDAVRDTAPLIERQVRGVELLSSRQKLMAGLPAYATYFGRDMLVSALMMQPIWREAMSEFVIASVLRKLGPGGQVSHEEALGGQAVREAAAEYVLLIKASQLDSAYQVLRQHRRVRENYHMIDDELQFPILVARWITDPDVSAARKRSFLMDRSELDEPRLNRLLRELALVARMTSAYAAEQTATNLISFAPRNGGWAATSWRDSNVGYAGGRFAMDVNAIWAPSAIESIQAIIGFLRIIGVNVDSVAATVPELASDTPLGRWVHDDTTLATAVHAWSGAWRHFLVQLGPAEVRANVAERLAALPEHERGYWNGVLERTRAHEDSLTFLALSLDAGGSPIGVANTDVATGLFLGNSAPRPKDLTAMWRDVLLFTRPYPVGLLIEGVGPVVANDAYATPAVWQAFERDRYHGPRVIWGREVNLFALGVARLIEEAPPNSTEARALRQALDRVLAAAEASGFQSELWSYEVSNGRVVPVRYGTGSDVQLWSTTDLAVQFALSRLR